MNKPLLHILHADDDEEDRFIFLESVKEVDENINLLQMEDGLSLIQYLNSVKNLHEVPCVIVSDMKMPLTDGTEVLKFVRSHPHWKHIPVIILSTSSTDYDRNLSLKLGATAFFSKPGSYPEVTRMVRKIMGICDEHHYRTKALA